MGSTVQATIIWLILLIMSGIAAWIGEFSTTNTQIMIFIVVSLMIKGQLIVDYFMGLKQVSWVWRGIMSAFCVVIGIIIIITYQLK